MAIPLAYNVRNLVVRRTTTLMTALGIALTVAVLVSDLALANGLKRAFRTSGNPQQILVLRKGSQSELGSALTREVYQDIRPETGIAAERAGEPMASLEMVTVISLPSIYNPKGMNVTLRGLAPVGMEMRDVRIRQGRWFQSGQREIVVGASIERRYPRAQLGNRLRFGRGEWKIVGIMDAGESAVNSEIWGDLNQITSDYNRQNGFNSVLIRAADASSVPALVHKLEDDRRINVQAMPETEYYERLTSAGAPLEFLGIFVSIIMAVGSSFAAMNTMYAAVARRSPEIATLRVIGFSRASILLSFFMESLLLSLLGGALGCLLALPLNGVTTGIGSFMTFSEIAFQFRVGPAAMMPGVLFALIVGTFGGVLPARMAARKEILSALREI
jgi:putative ABC transport system permease protein